MRRAHLSVHGESIVIDGIPLTGKPIYNDTEASQFENPVAIVVVSLLILTNDAERIGLTQGMAVVMRGVNYAVESFVKEDSFLTRVTLELA